MIPGRAYGQGDDHPVLGQQSFLSHHHGIIYFCGLMEGLTGVPSYLGGHRVAPQHLAHLHIRWKEGSGQKMEVPSAEAEAEVGDIHVKEVGGLDFGAYIVLSIERGHRDSGFGIQHRDVVAHSSVHVPL